MMLCMLYYPYPTFYLRHTPSSGLWRVVVSITTPLSSASTSTVARSPTFSTKGLQKYSYHVVATVRLAMTQRNVSQLLPFSWAPMRESGLSRKRRRSCVAGRQVAVGGGAALLRTCRASGGGTTMVIVEHVDNL